MSFGCWVLGAGCWVQAGDWVGRDGVSSRLELAPFAAQHRLTPKE